MGFETPKWHTGILYNTMKPLDLVVSPPAFVWDPYLTLTYVTFDGSRDIYFLLLVSSFGQVTLDRLKDGQTESDAYEPTVHMHRCAHKKRTTVWNTDVSLIPSHFRPVTLQLKQYNYTSYL